MPAAEAAAAAHERAEDAKAPVEASVDGVPAQSMDELVVFDHARRLEAPDVDERRTPETGERARHEQQAVETPVTIEWE